MKTGNSRIDDSLSYIRKIGCDELAEDIASILTGYFKRRATGNELSLGSRDDDKNDPQYAGNTELRHAVRAYLLCLAVYFRTPHARFDFATPEVLDQTKENCAGKSLDWINREIRYFVKDPAAQLHDLVDAAQRISDVEGVVYFLNRTRDDTNVSANPVCYHGVSTWLFGAGFVSKRWCAKEGMILDGNNANDYLGQGLLVEQDNWDKIPAGYVWNIHKKNDKTTCHWGVSLGNNKAAACNNTDQSPGNIRLAYEAGGTSQYGIFPFYDPRHQNGICDVLNKNAKYQFAGQDHPSGVNIVVRQINPLTEDVYY